MDREEQLFRMICDKLVQKHDYVAPGKMMSSPGITIRKKVFAFYHKQQMIFKLGKQFEPASHGIDNFSLLSPFKTKPPLAGWFCIPFEHSDKWEALAEQARKRMVD